MSVVSDIRKRVPAAQALEKLTSAAVLVLVLAGLGWLFDALVINIYALVLPNLLQTFRGNLALGGLITSIFLIGYTTGTFLGGTLADYLGRKKALGLSISSYSLGMALSAFAPTAATFALLRFVTGVGGGMELPTSAVYVTETWPAALRGRAMGLLHSFYGVGFIVAIVLAAAIVPRYGWRWAFFACVVPGILIFVSRLQLQESPRFRSMIEALRRDASLRRKVTLAELFRSEFRNTVLLHGMLWTSAAWGYWAFAIFAPFYLVKELHYPQAQVYWFIAAFNVAGMLGSWAMGAVTDRVGRRVPGIICPLLAIGSVIAFSTTRSPLLVLLFGSLEFVAISGAWVVSETFTSEVFPTKVRGTAFSAALTIGRIVSIFAPVLVGTIASRTSLAFAYQVSVAPWLLAVVAYAVSRETKGMSLSDA
jgi:putative MFS transporter